MRHPPLNYLPYCNTLRVPRTQRTERSNRRSHQPNRAVPANSIAEDTRVSVTRLSFVDYNECWVLTQYFLLPR